MPVIHISGPSAEPVTADEVKSAARIDGTEFDAFIPLAIKAIRRQAEDRLGRVLVTQTKELVIDQFPAGEIDLTLPDVSAIASVKYVDPNGVEQALDASRYSLDHESTPCWLLPAVGTDWPGVMDTANAVRVRFNAGYGSAAADVPENVRLWILAHVVQVLRSPDGLSLDNIKAMPYLDGLLDGEKVWRVA